MDSTQYRHWAAEAAAWAAGYRDNLRDLPVRSPAQPGETLALLPADPPVDGEDFATIFADFKRIVPAGLTHWQHPRFFAYFPANADWPSVLAEQLTASIGAQCMLWQTSPVATEMEMRTLEWLARMCALPAGWQGVIQDSASSATLAAITTAREKALGWRGNKAGLAGGPVLRFYASEHCHSSIDKALAITGVGSDNRVKVPCTASGAMDAGQLRAAIVADRQAGLLPAGIVAVVGSTSTGVCDDLQAVGAVARDEDLYLHVDAAWAGNTAICPEHRHLFAGLELADSYVFNPHKWIGTNFDLSAHYVRDPADLVRTMATDPAYLRTQHAAGMPDFCNWSVQLGRRFRALKLWFILRALGTTGLQGMIRNHVAWAGVAAQDLGAQDDFEVVAHNLSLVVFRHRPAGMAAEALDGHNARLLDAINADGTTYLTQTHAAGAYVIRLQVGHPDTTATDVEAAVRRTMEIARQLPGG